MKLSELTSLFQESVRAQWLRDGKKLSEVIIPDKKLHATLTDEKGENVKCYLVPGKYIRDNIDIDWVEGGNYFPSDRYRYIPKDEIWVDDENSDETDPIALHEFLERGKMKHHGWSYDKAHDFANKYELEFRHRLNDGEKVTLLSAATEYMKKDR